MTQSVLWYNNPTHSGMPALPSSSTAGSIITVLDGILVNGMNSMTLTSLTQASGVATATTPSTHNYRLNDWVDISGATPSAYNGRMQVTSVPSTNTFTFAIASGTTTPATGTINSIHPAFGWTKTFAGTNTACYRTQISPNSSLGFYMQINDANPYADTNASFQVRLCEGWTAMDTATTLGEQIRISKQVSPANYSIVGDYKTFYMFIGGAYAFCAGELTPLNPADAYPFFANRGYTANAGAYYGNQGTAVSNGGIPGAGGAFPGERSYDNTTPSCTMTWLKSITGVGGSVTGTPRMTGNRSNTAIAGGATIPFSGNWNTPNLPDNSMPVTPIYAEEFSTITALRGKFRGMYSTFGTPPFTLNGSYRYDSVNFDGSTRNMLMQSASIGYQYLLFDLTGPW